MKVSRRASVLVKAFAIALSLAMPLTIAASQADARPGGGGSRGSRTYSAPPSTTTAPTAQPMQRSITQPGNPAASAAAKTPGRGMMGGMLGGLAAGFLGAGLLGMLFGGGFMSGLGSFASILGLLVQVVLVVVVARLALNWWRRRNAPAGASASAYSANAAPQGQPDMNGAHANMRSGLGGALGGGAAGGAFGGMFGGAQPQTAPLEVSPQDYEAFERLLGEVQTAWSNEDVTKLGTLATPEMVSYFAGDLKANADRGLVNKVSDVKLLQGDLAEAWSEGNEQYATVAMRFGFVEKTVEKASGRIVDGSDQPTEATEIWTFVRRPGTSWELSAIQNT